jgi:hypothetical protein
MASRAPLLVAAALFFVGAAGLLVTFPGNEAVRAFVPHFRAESTRAPSPVSRVSDAPIPEPSFPVASIAEDAPRPAVDALAGSSIDSEATVNSIPEVHAAVVAAGAPDSEPPATPAPLTTATASSGDGAPRPVEVVAKDEAEREPSASDVSPVAIVTPTPEDSPPAGDSKTGHADTPTSNSGHAPTDAASKHGDGRSKSEHRPSEKEKPESGSGSAHN